MAKLSVRPLQPNPFTTHRDPQTGEWQVKKNAEQEANSAQSNSLEHR